MTTPAARARRLAGPARILSAVAALALVGSGALLAPSAATAAEGDVTWSVRTASNEFGSDRTSYTYVVQPGSSVEDAMTVTNKSAAPLTLGVYAADGYTTKSGGFDLLVAGKKSTGVGRWVGATDSTVEIAPGASAEVPFTVTVPADATPGDYAGGIVTSLTQADSDAQVNVDRRLGIRIALRVGGELKPALAIESPRLQWTGGPNPFAGGSVSFGYTLHNTGNAVLSAQQKAEVAGPFGWFGSSTSKIADPPRLLPGEKWNVRVPFTDVASAVWLSATTHVTPVLTDASGSSSAMAPVTASATGWAVPWLLVVLVLLVAAAIVAAVLLVRRAAARRRAREDERVQRAVDEALAAKDEVGGGSVGTGASGADEVGAGTVGTER